MREIYIEISEGIRVAPYEIIKPTIGIKFEVPEEVNIEEFYKEKYRVVKRLWNMHLYNLLYNTSQRHKKDSAFDYAQQLILSKEKFPTFIIKKKKKKGKS